MKDKIFNAQEVQAIIAGNKTQFREVIKPQPKDQQKHFHKITFSQKEQDIGKVFLSNHFVFGKGFEEKIECPYKVGQKIFCKEKYYRHYNKVLYRADFESDSDHEWWDACHMNKYASRLFLLIKEIRVERLQDISQEDAIAEGIEKLYGYHNSTFPEKYDFVFQDYRAEDCMTHNPKQSFSTLWNATHKKPEEKFEANPWVWVVSFEVVKC